MDNDFSLISPMKERRLEMKAIEQGWPISEEQRDQIVEHLIVIAMGKAGDAVPRGRIRATKCLAELDALNVQREQADRTKRVDTAILPPVCEQLSNQANEEMIACLQLEAILED